MVPFAVIDFLVDRLGLCGSRAHVQQQVQMAVQHLDGKEVHLESLGVLGILPLLLGLAMAEEEKAVGLCGAEVKGDGARLLGVPLVEDDIGLWRLEGDGVQSGHVLTLKGHGTVDLHLGVTLPGQPGQLQSHVIVFVHNLNLSRKRKSILQSCIQYLTHNVKDYHLVLFAEFKRETIENTSYSDSVFKLIQTLLCSGI